MQRTKLYLFVLTAMLGNRVIAQTDPHFTQNYTFPLYINPALAGGSDGDYRAAAVYRTQWGSITDPYRTTGFSFDTRTNRNIALGVQVENQSAGDGGFNYLNASASVAYTGVKFGKNEDQRIVLAIQAGMINRRVDESKFKWGEQWNPITGYNANNPTTESFAATSATTPDIGFGALYYDAGTGKKSNIFGGFSVYHLNKPKDPIISSQSAALNTIPMRFVLHGGVCFNISERARIIPHFLYMKQGTANEKELGTYAQFTVNDETDLMVGAYYRVNDAIAPYVGFDWKDLIVGLSYDVNASKLGSMTNNVNSFELTISYVKHSGTKSIFDFIHCPRL